MLAEGGDAGHPGDGAICDFAGGAEHERGEGGDEDWEGLGAGEVEASGHAVVVALEVDAALGGEGAEDLDIFADVEGGSVVGEAAVAALTVAACWARALGWRV